MAAAPTKERSIRLVRSPSADGVAVICITDRRRSTYYAVHEIPCVIGGRGFAVHRLGLGQLYHVRIGPGEDESCECLGYLSRQYCRHVLGLRQLIGKGVL